MKIYPNHSLKNFNTFGIDAKCNRLIVLESENDVSHYIQDVKENNNYFILGGGSNLLIKNNLDCDVLKVNFQGKKIVDEEPSTITLEVMAGENWHKFIEFSVNNNYSGLENLALIPGNVGSAPIQNIGAYGIEQDLLFVSLRGYNIETNKFELYFKDECKFEYRNSIFKNELKNKFIITSVTYKLNKFESPNLSYVELEKHLNDKKLHPTSKNIFQSVIEIRQSKLPTPSKIGNSGSFFRNPIITNSQFEELLIDYPDLRGYQQNNNKIKISAGWLIEKAGLKGYRVGDAGVYNKHALILVNYGNASGEDIWQIAEYVIAEVNDKFNIKLEPEVNIIE